MKKVFGTAIFCLAFFLSISTSSAQDGSKVNLDWESKYTSDYDGHGPVAVRFLTAQARGEQLIFDILIHNEDQVKYMCVWFNTSENAVHVDDELGGIYKGGKFTLNPMDNKFAPNQRKRLEIILHKPNQEAKLVNIHLGFSVNDVSGKPQEGCGDSIIAGGELNFHKLDWDISKLQ